MVDDECRIPRSRVGPAGDGVIGPIPIEREQPPSAIGDLPFDPAVVQRGGDVRERIDLGRVRGGIDQPRGCRRDKVEVLLDLAFCGRSTSVSAEVVVVVDPALAEAGGTSAGVSVRPLERVSALRSRPEEPPGAPPDARPPSPPGQRRPPRPGQ